MKTTEVEKSTTAQNHIQAKREPFFNKDGQGGFFSKSNEVATPFFSPTTIQPKLNIGKPNDKYEVEADTMADKVVQRLNNPSQSSNSNTVVQAKCSSCEEKEKLQKKEEDEVSENSLELQRKPIFESNAEQPEADVQTKPLTPFIQAKCANCEEEELQKKDEKLPEEDIIQEKSENSQSQPTSDLQTRLTSSKGKGNPLSPDTQSSMGSAFGADFSNVRVHRGSEAIQMNKDLGAQAFTNGSDIYFNQGKYDTNSSSGKHLLAHELTHTVQQGGTKGSINTKLDNSIQLKGENDCEKEEEGGSEGEAAANETAPPASCAQSNPPAQQPPEGQEEPDREESPASVESQEGASVDERQGHAPPADENAPAGEQDIQEGAEQEEQPLGPCEMREQQSSAGQTGGQVPTKAGQGSMNTVPSAAQNQSTQNGPGGGSQSNNQGAGSKKGKVDANTGFIQIAANKGISPMIVKNGLGEQASPELLVERNASLASSQSAWETLSATRAGISELSLGKLEFRKPKSGNANGLNVHSQSGTIASEFLASGAARSNEMISQKLGAIDEMKKGIVTKKNNLLIDIESKKTNSTSFFTKARNKASKKAQASKNILEGHHAATLLQIEINAIISKALLQQHNQTKKTELDQKYTDQITALNQTYSTAYTNLIGIGNTKGNAAVTKANAKARSYRVAEGASAGIQDKVQNRKKDGFWDGYLTYNRYMARADAASEVGKQYREGMKEQAKAQADQMLCGKGKDQEMAAAIYQTGGENLQCSLDNSLEAIDRRKQAAIMQATHAKQELFASIDNSLKATVNQLTEKEAIQLQLLNDYGVRQIMAIEKDGESAIASTLQGINEAAQKLLLFLQEYRATISSSEAPDKISFQENLNNISVQFDQSLQNTKILIDQSLQNGIAAINEAENNAIIAIRQLHAQGITDGQTVVASFNSVINGLQTNGVNSYSQLLTETNSGIQGELENGKSTMDAVVTGIGSLFERITTGLEAQFSESATQMENGMQITLDNDLDIKICSEAEKAAADVQPWWKTALKILLVIIVIVVVALVIGPAIIGAVGAAASALAGSLGAGAALAGTIGAWAGPIIGGAIVGAMSGAVIQVGNNLIDIAGTDKELTWDSVTKGVWGAMIAGAIGGALGGLGGQFAQVIMGRLGAGLSGGWQFVSQFGIEGAFDVVGGILGDLAAGNPITWESIVMGLAIGGAVQVSMGGMSSLARRSAQARVGGVDVPTTGGGFKARAGRAAERITDFQGRMMEAGQNFGGRAGFGRNAPSIDATKQGLVDANQRIGEGEFFPTRDVDNNAPRTDIDSDGPKIEQDSDQIADQRRPGKQIFDEREAVYDSNGNPIEGTRARSGEPIFNRHGERIMSHKEMKRFIREIHSWGDGDLRIRVVRDKTGKNMPDQAAAAFDYSTGTIYIINKATFLELFHESAHARQWLSVGGPENYTPLGSLAREEHVFREIMRNRHLFNDAEILRSQRVIFRYRNGHFPPENWVPPSTAPYQKGVDPQNAGNAPKNTSSESQDSMARDPIQDWDEVSSNPTLKEMHDQLSDGTIPRAFEGTLTIQEEAALKFYTTNEGYKLFNQALRGEIEMTPFFEAQKAIMDRAMAKLPISKYNETNEFLYRIESHSDNDVVNNIYPLGKEITMEHFFSTTYSVEGMHQAMMHRHHTLIVKIRAKNGKLIEPLSTLQPEKEILFAAGTRFRVTNYEGKIHPLYDDPSKFDIAEMYFGGPNSQYGFIRIIEIEEI